MKTPHTVLLREYLDQEGDEGNIIAFKEAGDELVDFVARGEKYRWFEVFLRPIGFLYRHYLELELKYWIKEIKGNQLKGHDLRCLWFKLKALIEPYCESQVGQEMLSEVEEVILIFDEYDPTGEGFRYTRTMKGAETLRNVPSRIDVKKVKILIERVSNFFTGLDSCVSI